MIIGYDPARHGNDALRLGRLFTAALGARPHVVVTMPWPNQIADPRPPRERVEEALADEFERVRDELGDPDVRIDAAASSSPAMEISELADGDPGARLIVLGSAHRGPVGRTLLGSVSESLMHGAPCAVAIAPRGYGDGERPSLRRIAVAYDGSDESRVALDTAVGLARRCGAAITLLGVADYPHYGYSTTWAVLSAQEITDADKEAKRELLAEATELIPGDVPHDARLLVGSAGQKLAEASREFDLLVAGSRAYGPVRRTLLGSTTRKLSAHCECPLLVLPRGAGEDPMGLGSEAA